MKLVSIPGAYRVNGDYISLFLAKDNNGDSNLLINPNMVVTVQTSGDGTLLTMPEAYNLIYCPLSVGEVASYLEGYK